MKGIKLVCVGKVKESYLKKGISEAEKRIRKRFPLMIRECADEPTPDQASSAEEKRIKETEGRRILSCIDSREDYVVALCIHGRQMTSDQWKEHMRSLPGQIPGWLVFVIGGSLGLSDEVIKGSREKLSFSSMTFPHQMMRLILLDQIADWI